MTRKSIPLLIMLLTAAALGARPAHATNYNWLKEGEGWFDDPANWSPGGYPDDSSDVAIFDLPSDYYVRFDKDETNRRFEVRGGTVTLSVFDWPDEYTYTLDPLFPHSDTAAVIGTTAGPLATLTVVGDVDADAELQIGRDAGSNGKMRMAGVEFTYGAEYAEWTSSWSTLVGVGGTGELELYELASLTDGDSVLGYDPGSTGSATVMPGCDWSSTGPRTVGRNGTGTLLIDKASGVGGGGRVENDGDGEIAAYGGSTGTVVVGGVWYNNASLYVGGASAGSGGSGALIINYGRVEVAADMAVCPTGTVTIINGGECLVSGQLETVAGSTLDLADGKLSLGSANLAAGTLNWTGGTLEFPTGGATIESNEGLGASLTVPSGGTLSVFGALAVGPDFSGMLTVNGSTVTSGSGLVGSIAESSVAAIVLLQGSGASWTMPGQLTVRGHNMAKVQVVGGATLSSGSALVASLAGTTATIQLSDANTQWNSGSVYLGGDAVIARGSGTLEVIAGAAMNVSGTLKVWDDFDVDVTDSTLTVGSLEVAGGVHATGASAVNVPGGSVSVGGGGTLVAPITGDAATQVTLQGAGSSWSMTGPLQIATTTPGSGHIGTLTLGPDTSVTATGTVEVLDNNALTLGGGTISAPVIQLADNDFAGFGTLAGDVTIGGNVIATGNLTIGNPASYTGVQIGGNLVVGSHTVTVNKAGFFNIGLFTDISGGSLNVPGGVAIPVGNSLVAFGTINGRLAAQSGSTIDAAGNLSLGDAASPVGFFSDGELLVHDHTVTIHDANQALLGSLTTLGEGANPGTLVAANGAVLEFGKNVVGFGTVDTPNDPTRPLINNGYVGGNSAGEPITLAGYVKGVGTFDNVEFTGTHSPGLSTTRQLVGGLAYAGSSTLVMEVGGAEPGGGHDQLVSDGTITLGGTLDVVTLEPFRPGHNDTFQIMTFASRGGTTFDGHQGLDLGDRLTLTPTYNATDLVLVAVQGGPGEWAVDADGEASVPANWSAGLPNGIGDLATFGSVITVPRQVAVDVPTTLGGIQFDSAQAYALAGPNPLTFETEAGAAAINVADVAATHVIAAAVVLADALEIDAGELGTLVFEGLLDSGAGQTITKTGDGTLIINGPQDHAPGALLDILDGTVEMNSDAGSPGLANLSITVSGDAVLDFGANQYLDTLSIQGEGELTVNGGITLEVTGDVDIGGSRTVLVNGTLNTAGVTVASGGTLGGGGTINGAVTVESGGTLTPGASVGTLTIDNNLTFGDGGNKLVAELLGADTDSVDVTGTLTLGDDTALEFVFGADDPFQGGTYTLASYDDLTGTFSSVTDLGAYSTGVDYGTGTGDAITIELLAGLLAGDANLDRNTNFSDYVRVSNNYGIGTTWAEGDVTGDGAVNFSDYVRISNNYGASAPEPATLLLMGAGLALAITRKHNGPRS